MELFLDQNLVIPFTHTDNDAVISNDKRWNITRMDSNIFWFSGFEQR